MNKSQQNNDDFGAFLWSMQQSQNKGDEPRKTPMKIIRIISHSESTRVELVMSKTKATWSEFIEGLKYLEEAGLVRLEEDSTGSVLRLTDDGQQWAQTMLDWADEEDDEEPQP